MGHAAAVHPSTALPDLGSGCSSAAVLAAPAGQALGTPSFRPPCLLALLLLRHLPAAADTKQLPVLLLASRELFVLLATLLPGAG